MIDRNDQPRRQDSESASATHSSLLREIVDAIDQSENGQVFTQQSVRNVLAVMAMLARVSPGCVSEQPVDGGDVTIESDAWDVEFPFPLGRFEIREVLGQGGFGTVFRAVDTSLGREIALKIPRFETLLSRDAQRRFEREAQAAAVLDHAGIVPVYDSGELGPMWFIACGLVRGPSLGRWLKDQPVLPAYRVAAQLVADLADAVQHAHDRGILHLDLKPSNVLLEPLADSSSAAFPFQARLSDFGLAGRIDWNESQSESMQVGGTYRYMSPEQTRGNRKEISTGCDIYGLGVVLYELLTGAPPFTNETGPQLFRQITEDEPRPIRTTRPDAPPDLEAICLKCLEKEPHRRYSSASDLASDLRRFLNGYPVTARKIGALQRLLRTGRRHPAITALAAGLLVAVVAGLTGIGYQWRESQWHAAEAQRQATEAAEQRLRAEAHLADAQESLLDMAWMLQESSPFLTGEPHVMNVLHGKLASYHSRLTEDNASPEMRLPIVAAMSSFAALANIEGATKDGQLHNDRFRKAADIWWQIVHKWPDRPTHRRALTLHLLSMAEYCRRTEQNEMAAQCREEAQRALMAPWTGANVDASEYVHMATSLEDLAGTLRRVHRNEDARCLRESVIMLFAHLRTLLPHDNQVLMRWAKAQIKYAADLEGTRQGNEANEILAAVESDIGQVFDWKLPDRELGLVLAEVLRRQAVIARDRKDLPTALEVFKRADKVLEAAAAADALTADYRREHRLALRGLGFVQLALGDKEAAFDTMCRCTNFFRQSQAHQELSAEGQMKHGRIAADAGTIAIDLGMDVEAEQCLAEAVEAFGRVPGPTRWTVSDLRANAESTTRLARMREVANKSDEAHALYERALGLWQKLNRREPRSVPVKQRLEFVERVLAGAPTGEIQLDKETLTVDADENESAVGESGDGR